MAVRYSLLHNFLAAALILCVSCAPPKTGPTTLAPSSAESEETVMDGIPQGPVLASDERTGPKAPLDKETTTSPTSQVGQGALSTVATDKAELLPRSLIAELFKLYPDTGGRFYGKVGSTGIPTVDQLISALNYPDNPAVLVKFFSDFCHPTLTANGGGIFAYNAKQFISNAKSITASWSCRLPTGILDGLPAFKAMLISNYASSVACVARAPADVGTTTSPIFTGSNTGVKEFVFSTTGTPKEIQGMVLCGTLVGSNQRLMPMVFMDFLALYGEPSPASVRPIGRIPKATLTAQLNAPSFTPKIPDVLERTLVSQVITGIPDAFNLRTSNPAKGRLAFLVAFNDSNQLHVVREGVMRKRTDISSETSWAIPLFQDPNTPGNPVRSSEEVLNLARPEKWGFAQRTFDLGGIQDSALFTLVDGAGKAYAQYSIQVQIQTILGLYTILCSGLGNNVSLNQWCLAPVYKSCVNQVGIISNFYNIPVSQIGFVGSGINFPYFLNSLKGFCRGSELGQPSCSNLSASSFAELINVKVTSGPGYYNLAKVCRYSLPRISF